MQISLITGGSIGKISVWADGSKENRIQAVMYLLPVLVDGFRVMSIHNKKENGGCNIMRKLRERLNNKKGFTLVELIVVIVIILILAAVLIPNVMRYINSARQSAFQSEASSYMTELQGYAAEHYAKKNADLVDTSGGTLPTDYTMTAIENSQVSINVSDEKATGFAELTKDSVASIKDKTINAYVYHGAVIAFSYTNGEHFVSWKQGEGWTNVDESTYKEAAE